ncbi:uncharacterized protein DS421_3g96520 [Arachis hypogaea]|nr:uncharacterized protein DS421_3g96520 [Arachis hypogaea]
MDTSKMIEQSIFLPNFSSLIIFKIKGQLMSNRSAQVIFWQIYLQSPLLKDWYIRLGCVNFEILNNIDIGGDCTFFFFGHVFSYLIFLDKVFNEIVPITKNFVLFFLY